MNLEKSANPILPETIVASAAANHPGYPPRAAQVNGIIFPLSFLFVQRKKASFLGDSFSMIVATIFNGQL
jgi:hypothetical protein